MDQFLLAFLHIKEFDKPRGLRGGVLITDKKTEPIEFRCTSVIQPTALQQIFWGGRLESHIATKLVGQPLLNSLTNRMSLVVVQRPEFLELRSSIEIPLIQILRNEELSESSPLSLEDTNDMLPGTIDGSEPVIINAHREYPKDRKIAQELLRETVNVLEPFERIVRALEVIHRQEATKQGG